MSLRANREEGAKEQQPQVTGTVSTSSTVENNLVPLSQPQSSSSGQLVPRTRKSDLNPYQELIESGNYEGIAKLGKMTEVQVCDESVSSDDYCQSITIVCYKFMKENKLIPYFLVYGNIELVRKVVFRDGVPSEKLLTDWEFERCISFVISSRKSWTLYWNSDS